MASICSQVAKLRSTTHQFDVLFNRYSPNLRTFAAQIQRKMAQDPQAQAIRKRKATLKIARLKAAKEAAEQNGGAKEKTA